MIGWMEKVTLSLKDMAIFGDLCWRKPRTRGLCHAEGWVLCYGDPEGGDQKDRCPGRERNLSLPETNIQTLSFMGKKLPTSLNWWGEFSPEILVAINSSTWKMMFFPGSLEIPNFKKPVHFEVRKKRFSFQGVLHTRNFLLNLRSVIPWMFFLNAFSDVLVGCSSPLSKGWRMQ